MNVTKLSIYNLGTGDGTCYVWSEVEGNRGSCEVASALYSYLLPLPSSVKHVLYSDTCEGHNRNKNVLAMFKQVLKVTSIEKIEHKFMEKGHSHMEVDSIHAAIEAKKKSASIYSPRDYYVLMRAARTRNPY